VAAHDKAAIELRLSARASHAPVRVDILDLNGRLVRNVLHATRSRGRAAPAWDGLDAAVRWHRASIAPA
jgi:hypothetical protein